MKNQSVYDIVKEVLDAHEIFASDYNRIAPYFNLSSTYEISKALFSFLKSNVHYDVESEKQQTTKSPSALLTQGYGDCKHYAGFIAGVLDALNRLYERNIDWHYRFASYSLFDKEPGHVFVIVNDGPNEYWIDPVLKTFNERLEPTYILDKKPVQMLQRVSGINDIQTDTIFLDDDDRELSPELLQAINLLLLFHVLDATGKVNDDYLVQLQSTMNADDFRKLADARALIQDKAVSGLFSSIWTGIKTVSLIIPRTDFLQLVLLNFRSLATKMATIIFVGTTTKLTNTAEMNELKKKWESLGGDFSKLVLMVAGGRLRKETLGSVPAIGAAQVAAWAVTAAAIIAAMTPIINNLVSKISASSVTPYNGGANTPFTGGTSGAMDFIKNNPLIIAAAAAAGIYFYSKRKKKAI